MGDMGTCSFCGFGDGYLGETGDETTQYLPGAVRSGTPRHWTYEQHPNAWGDPPMTVTWCGNCIGGLTHKYQRYDDGNLHALLISSKVRMELDAPRFSMWGEKNEAAFELHVDDPAIHLDKLRITRDIEDMQNETFRRAGFDLTTRGWRP